MVSAIKQTKSDKWRFYKTISHSGRNRAIKQTINQNQTQYSGSSQPFTAQQIGKSNAQQHLKFLRPPLPRFKV